MEEKDFVSSTRFDDKKQTVCQERDFQVGEKKLEVKLASDMDHSFVNRLEQILISDK